MCHSRRGWRKVVFSVKCEAPEQSSRMLKRKEASRLPGPIPSLTNGLRESPQCSRRCPYPARFSRPILLPVSPWASASLHPQPCSGPFHTHIRPRPPDRGQGGAVPQGPLPENKARPPGSLVLSGTRWRAGSDRPRGESSPSQACRPWSPALARDTSPFARRTFRAEMQDLARQHTPDNPVCFRLCTRRHPHVPNINSKALMLLQARP